MRYATSGHSGGTESSPPKVDPQAGFSFLRFLRRGLADLFSNRDRSGLNKFAVFLAVVSVLCGCATYAALTATPPFGNDPDTVFWLLNVDLVVLLVMGAMTARRIVSLWFGVRQGIPGAGLHVRIVYIFSILAIAPAIVMTVFSAVFFHFGVQSWFSERVRTAVAESQAVARAYLEEHQRVIKADVLAMAYDLERELTLLYVNPEKFEKILDTQSLLRDFSEAVIFDGSGRILARSGLAFTLELDLVSEEVLEKANHGDVVFLADSQEDRVRALLRLGTVGDTYLFAGRLLEPNVLEHLDSTRRAVHEYEILDGQKAGFQRAVILIFIVVALLMLMAAIWSGLALSRRLVSPIGALVEAAESVRGGDLHSKVRENSGVGEFDYLARSFNRMTSQIRQQRDELIAANHQIDRRRRFTETVLSGVSSGVLSVEPSGKIILANLPAASMLRRENLVSTSVLELFPEIGDFLEQAFQKTSRVQQFETRVVLPDGTRRTFLVRVGVDLIGDDGRNAVITFDDLTELLSAQRKAAWADVARRIAHEIKNPLTPIRLAAERLERKYLEQIAKDRDIFSQCVGTIVRHVEDIGRMVSEFSDFARMPEPVMKSEDLRGVVNESLFLQRQAQSGILFQTEGLAENDPEIRVMCDARQVLQAVTNILQNALESIKSREDSESSFQKMTGSIEVLLFQNAEDCACLCVTDDGPGFPESVDPERLVEPYVTHKERGTGLGLAIVRKIMEDHGGRLLLGVPDWLRSNPRWKDLGGATVCLILPLEGESRTSGL